MTRARIPQGWRFDVSKKKEFCVNAIHRLDGEPPQKVCEESNIYCKDCYIKNQKRPRPPFNPNALRSHTLSG